MRSVRQILFSIAYFVFCFVVFSEVMDLVKFDGSFLFLFCLVLFCCCFLLLFCFFFFFFGGGGGGEGGKFNSTDDLVEDINKLVEHYFRLNDRRRVAFKKLDIITQNISLKMYLQNK